MSDASSKKAAAIKSFSDLGARLVTATKAVEVTPQQRGEELYQQSKTVLASGNTAEAIKILEATKKLPGFAAEFRSLIQDRITAIEKRGRDEETNKLRQRIKDHVGLDRSLSPLDIFRSKHRLDKPQHRLRLAGIQGVSMVGVYRWQGDPQGQQLWSKLVRQAKDGERATLTWFGLALCEHWEIDQTCKSWRSKIDFVVPIPPNPIREAERSVDIAGYLAERFARTEGFPVHQEILRRSGGRRARDINDWSELRAQYTLNTRAADRVRGRTILLIDDVITTGRTVNICAQLLLEAGAVAVYVLAVAQSESTLKESFHMGERHAERIDTLAPWLCLSDTPDLGPVRVRALLEVLKTPDAVLAADAKTLQGAKGIGPKLAQAVVAQGGRQYEYPAIAANLLSAVDRIVGAHIFTVGDSDYPMLLRASNHAVPVLYAAGKAGRDLSSSHTVAIVGSRRVISELRETTKALAETLSNAGWTVVSGLAEGCDALAHEGALAGKSPTWAFLGCGVDQIYPPSNKKLRDRILERGWLFSEYAFGTRVNQDFLRKRNNLIVGAASAVIIIQTAVDGGTMNAARSATQQDRPIFCMSPQIEGALFSGNALLLQEQKARLLDPPNVLKQLSEAVGGVGGARPPHSV